MSDKQNDYVLSELAERDLLNIFLTGIEKFGLNVASRYAQTIEETLTYLSLHSDMGKKRSELFHGAFSFPIGSHIIFYRKTRRGLEVARILHQRMDHQRRLDTESKLPVP